MGSSRRSSTSLGARIVKPCSDLPCVIYGSRSSKDIPYQRQRLISRVELVAWKVPLSAEYNADDSAAPLPIICW